MSIIKNHSNDREHHQITPKRFMVALLGSLLLANPIVSLVLFDGPILAMVLPIFVLGCLLIADMAGGKRRRWVFAYTVNFTVFLSIGFHSETIFRILGEKYIVKDLYTVTEGYSFNKPFLNITLDDREYRSQYVTNSQGFRAPEHVNLNKEIKSCDWLFLGDSFTQGAQVDYENLYTSKLQSYFPDKVIINAGVSGIGIPEELNMAKALLPKLNPDVVFLQVSPFNDFLTVQPREMNLFELLLHHSELFRFLLYDIAFERRESLPLGRWTEPFYPTHQENSDYNIFYIPSSPRKERDLKNYQRYIEELSSLCKELRAKLVVFIVPSKEQADKRFLENVISEFMIDISNLDMEKPSRLLQEWIAGSNVQFIDLTPAFRKSQIPLFFDVDEHPNVDGHTLIAAELAAKMGSRSGIDSGPESVTSLFSGARYPSLNADGSLMAYQKMSGEKLVAVLTTPDSNKIEDVEIGDSIVHPRLSPDGKWLAFTQGDVDTWGSKVFIYNLESGQKKCITTDINEFGAIPQFSLDGKRLAFAAWQYDDVLATYTTPQIVVLDLGTGQRRGIGDGGAECWRPCFSPDGNFVAYISNENGSFDIYLKNLCTDEVKRLTHTPYDEWDPQFSPDGSTLIYASRKDDNWDLYELNIASGKEVRLTASKGDEWDPVYSPNEKKIFYAGEFGFSGGVYYKSQEPPGQFALSGRSF